ncbi:MAG: PAS domain S-box protein [Desulfobacterales bacterium]|nr:PAS domain S-box protein [Desulfobacterales bacterium]
MTDEKNHPPRVQSNSTSIREQAEQKIKAIPFPDFASMTLEEIQQQFYEMQVKQIEAELQNEQLRSQLEERDDQAALFRIVTENMLDMVALTDMEGHFTFAGKAHEILGYEPGFLIGKNVMDFVHPEDHPRILEEFNELVASGYPRRVEYRYKCKDGNYIWFETIGNFIKDENGIPQGIVFSARDITGRKQAIEKLKEREAFIKATLDNLPVGVAVNSVDPEVHFTYMNENFARFYRTTRDALAAPNDFWEVVYTDATFREQIKKRVLEDYASNDPERMYWEDIPVSRPGKEPFYITAKNIPLPENNLVVSTVWDVTDRKRAEEEREKLQKQLAQAQKMESVGRLAGGVAHDFNNKLTIINGYAEMAIDMMDPPDPLRETIQEIYTAGKKSADIVRQLMAFARKQTINPVQLDLNDTISGMLKMIQRLIGENIELVWHPGNNLWPVKLDPSQADQIMANLAVNARDAIADVGEMTIETNNVEVDENYCTLYPYFVPGQYVMLSVSDDGSGMDKETLANLFEPFFTTKEVGKGTGLGLAMIYGIVKQNNGFINVDSEPGQGTTVKIYLPRLETEEPALEPAKETTRQLPTGTETILIVEDEIPVLQMSRQILERLGYTVWTAGNPSAALQLFEAYNGTIHLLITDVIMPEMNGRDLASQMAMSRPGLKILYMSGHTADVIAHKGVIDEGVQFIQKPFSMQELAVKVRDAIEQ